MFGFFGWLRTQTRNAILAGIGDAAADLDADGEHGEAVQLLRQRLQAALPAPEEVAPSERRKGGRS